MLVVTSAKTDQVSGPRSLRSLAWAEPAGEAPEGVCLAAVPSHAQVNPGWVRASLLEAAPCAVRAGRRGGEGRVKDPQDPVSRWLCFLRPLHAAPWSQLLASGRCSKYLA